MLALLVLAIVAVTIPAAHSQAFSVLYNFGTNSGDPTNPFYAGIIAQGRDGNMYSTATNGGTHGVGAMFSITPTGILTVPYSFDSPYSPYSGLTLGTDGNFYGTTRGALSSDLQNVFKITPSGTLTVLHNLIGSYGSAPFAPPIQGMDGNFYGTTTEAGTNNLGTVYKVTPTGTFTTLYSFDGTHGEYPADPLVQGTDGNFYGTTWQGGTFNYGVVFKITPSGKLATLYSFDGTHGELPYDPLVQGTDGNFYGTTASGGTSNYGVVFKITPSGTLTVLHNLAYPDGAYPYAGLVQATDGNFYGTTYGGGLGLGTIFTISPLRPYTYKVLYNFDDTIGAGAYPLVTLLQHTNGILYGDTFQGGSGSVGCAVGACGIFYSLDMGLKPFVRLVSTSGKVGKTIEILGQGFTGTTGVSFNGTTANLKVSSDTYLTATVPTGATTGTVTVTTPGGPLTSNKKFRVTPQVLSFNPTSGKVGTPVMITGVSLTQTNKVTFGGVKATTFTVNMDTQVTANVPPGARTGKIAITTQGGTAVSSRVFTVTQ
jgi:uncharacterized repeat protein (TIGR03803 family)